MTTLHIADDACSEFMICLQREVAEHITAALDAGGGSMNQLCRLLLAADTYQVPLLRNYCLAGLAQAFYSLHTHTPREQAIFEAFVDAVAPKVNPSHSYISRRRKPCWRCCTKDESRLLLPTCILAP